MIFEKLVEMQVPGGLFRSGQLMAGSRSPAGLRRQLDRWVKSGRITPLRRGGYFLKRPYRQEKPHPFFAANLLQPHSYISLHSALAYYDMIPEYVPVTTSVGTGRPETIETPLGSFKFHHLAERLFFGFEEREVSRNQQVLIASPEKALVDLLYLTPKSDNRDYLGELRLNLSGTVSWDKLETTAAESGSKKTARAVKLIVEMFREEEE